VPFWSGERLAEELAKGLIEPFTPSQIDCASYNLCVGIEAFVTEDRFTRRRSASRLVTILGDPPDHTVRIDPGQFAFLMTYEVVKVPANAIALISMRAKYKFQGLINVSGFHVDPGWDGRLLFTVYNAGPAEIVIERLEKLFLIVYADLDRHSAKTYDGSSKGQSSIKPALLQGMLKQVFSPLMLQRKIDALEGTVTWLKTGAAVGVGFVTPLLALVAVFPNFTGSVIAEALRAAGYELVRK
jgi:dCTP deaminase